MRPRAAPWKNRRRDEAIPRGVTTVGSLSDMAGIPSCNAERRTFCVTGRRRAQRGGNPTASNAILLGAPLEPHDTDTRPRVLPGLVTSIHHRKKMLHTLQALLVALRGFWDDLVLAVECMVTRSLCAPACAALVFMAGCPTAPHPAMSQRRSRLARLKGALRRAAPALDPLQPAAGKLHAARRSQQRDRPAVWCEAGEASVSGGLGKVLPS